MFANTGATNGRPIVASLAGTVQSASFDSGGGWHVKLNHGNGWQTLYLHMIAPPIVSVGQSVAMGQQLGNVGSTGASGAPHLHYEQLADGNKTESWFNGIPSGIRSDGDPNTGPLFIGGPTSGPVDVVSRNGCAPSQSSGAVVFNGVLFEFARGADNTLKYWFASGGGWSGMQTIGGSIRGGVSSVVHNGVLHVFGIGTDGTVKYWFASGGSWSGMQSFGGGLA